MRENSSGVEFGQLSKKEQDRQEEAKKIAEEIGDPRLRADQHLEYFTIHTDGRVRHIPKRRIGDDPGRINGDIAKWLKQELAELDKNKE